MATHGARIIQWAEREVRVRVIPVEGLPDKKTSSECEGSHAIVYAGHGRTGSGGSWTVSLRAINCIPPGPAHNHQPSVVATPTTDGPTDDIPRPYNLVVRTNYPTITIWSFRPNGDLAENVAFSWHCIVEGELVG
jgi:hypothetical protein